MELRWPDVPQRCCEPVCLDGHPKWEAPRPVKYKAKCFSYFACFCTDLQSCHVQFCSKKRERDREREIEQNNLFRQLGPWNKPSSFVVRRQWQVSVLFRQQLYFMLCSQNLSSHRQQAAMTRFFVLNVQLDGHEASSISFQRHT